MLYPLSYRGLVTKGRLRPLFAGRISQQHFLILFSIRFVKSDGIISIGGVNMVGEMVDFEAGDAEIPVFHRHMTRFAEIVPLLFQNRSQNRSCVFNFIDW